MKIETKFDLGQQVHSITYRQDDTWVPCSACNATGSITLADGKNYSCPNCHERKGHREYLKKEWMHEGLLTVGQIRVTMTKTFYEEEYMCIETGVGSGTIHYGNNLCGSVEEATAECEKRNLSLTTGQKECGDFKW